MHSIFIYLCIDFTYKQHQNWNWENHEKHYKNLRPRTNWCRGVPPVPLLPLSQRGFSCLYLCIPFVQDRFWRVGFDILHARWLLKISNRRKPFSQQQFSLWCWKIALFVWGIAKNTKSASGIACIVYFPMFIFLGATLPYLPTEKKRRKWTIPQNIRSDRKYVSRLL